MASVHAHKEAARCKSALDENYALIEGQKGILEGLDADADDDDDDDDDFEHTDKDTVEVIDRMLLMSA